MRPIGQTDEIQVDVRILSATHKDLGELVAQGEFREDLFYRVNVIELNVPPLRDRGDDVFILTKHTLERLATAMQVPIPSLDAPAGDILGAYEFPGNVRELENMLERAVTLCDGSTITAGDIQVKAGGSTATAPEPDAALGDKLENIERDEITQALEQSRYNKTATAKRLGLSLRALRYRIKKLGIE